LGYFILNHIIYFFLYRDYAILVAMFFCANVCNNYAFNFNIPMPLHMIFRAVSISKQQTTFTVQFTVMYMFVADKITYSTCIL
jgi:hypothetical protein